ncbi:MAG: hypothetical protein PVJ03_03105 [Chromatiaceae bacterium]
MIDAKKIEGRFGNGSADIFLAQEPMLVIHKGKNGYDSHAATAPLHCTDAVFRLIDLVINEAGMTSVSICGELAGRLGILARLIASGIDILSAPAAVVPDVKASVCKCQL